MSFNFGGTNPSASKSLFGTTPGATSAATPAAQGFNFGAGNPAQTGGGFSFGGTAKPTATGAATGGFSFGTPAGTTAVATPVAGLTGTAPAAAATGFSFGAPASQPQAAAAAKTTGFPGGFTLGGSTPAKPAGQGLNLGGLAQTTVPTAGLNFGAAKPVAAAAPSALGIAPAAAKPAPALGAAKTGGLNLGVGLGSATPAAKPGGPTLGGLGSSAPVSRAGALNLGTPAAKPGGLTLGGAAATGTLGVGAKSAAPSGLTLSLGKPTAGLSAAPTTTAAAVAAAVPAGPTMNYRELEEAINKWTVELEEQEKVFLQQATQVNGWDRLLVENGEKITVLHNDVEKVKTDQQRLEHELDYIVAQQRELEDMLAPLEETIKTQQGSIFTQHADVEREHTYQLAETIDSQLKRMVQDLKEVIEHLNTSNSAGEGNDPIHQIAKILNAHMDSLQWIDHNTAMCQRKVDEISRQSEIVRRDQERNVQLAFD